jgi:long-chain fatty acid transport protein
MNNCPKRSKSGHLAAIFLSTAAGLAMGSGFDLPDQDAFAVGRGLAVIATADNPSAIFYNPAGLTQLTGHNFQIGAYGIYLDPQFTPPGGGNTFHNQTPWGGIPQFFYAYGNEKKTLSCGLGVYMPSGLKMRWQDNTGFRTLGTDGSVEQLAINPVVAIKVLPTLSIGAGISANYAKLDLKNGILWPTQPYDQLHFQGDGWGVAGNFGVLWQPVDEWSYGVAFQTGAKIKLEGDTTAYNNVAIPAYGYPAFNSSSSASTDFQIPLKIGTGISYRPTPKWNVEFDVNYIDWNSLNNLNINQDNPYPLFPKTIPVALEWESSYYYELGATRYLDNGWHVSAGYIFNQNSVPDTHYTTVVADQDRHFFSVGVGRKGEQIDFDIAYQFGYGPDRTVSGSAPSSSGQTADGTYGFVSHAVAVSVGYHF